jgi:hypothetical protein
MKTTILTLFLLLTSTALFAQYTPDLPKPPEVELSGDYQKDFEIIEARLKLSLYQGDMARRQIDRYRYQSNVGIAIMFIGAALTTALVLANPEDPIYVVGGVVLLSGYITALTAKKHLKATPPPNFDNP